MKRTLHFFGDSFTQGHALRKSSSIWPRLVAKGLDLKYKNYAQGGASPFFIVKNLVDTFCIFHNFNERNSSHTRKHNR